MVDRAERIEDKPPYGSVAELFRDGELLACMAYLFARESGIGLSKEAIIRASTVAKLKERGWVSASGGLTDRGLAYSCYEYERQLNLREPLDRLLIEEASGRGRIADICCGGGATSFALLKAERRERMCGIDAAREPIELMRERLRTEGGYVRGTRSDAGETGYAVDCREGGERVETVIGDVHQLPWEEGSFDLAVCRAALHYLDARTAVREMYRVLEAGGKLFLLVHGSGYPLDYLIHRRRIWSMSTIVYALQKLRAAWGTKHASGHSQGRFLRRRQLESFLMEAGFRHIRYYTDKHRMIAGRFPVYFAMVAEKQG
ncbi:class I SAM-dependent methyltransferase [Paenibacillus sp. NPDC057967]|uniref:class I SAM-dependent methyltransferase n=1 Tax=Paenibacillus sp. NPDC057967 TaxID=3346293 RepID=UPI0036D97676